MSLTMTKKHRLSFVFVISVVWLGSSASGLEAVVENVSGCRI